MVPPHLVDPAQGLTPLSELDVFQFLLDRSLDSRWTVARAFHRLAAGTSRVANPPVRYALHGRTLELPLSHDLPWNRRVHPDYGENLSRLARFLRERDGALRLIDVGANVGDSWCLTDPAPGDTALLIEGSPRYFAYLERNTAGTPGVTRSLALVSDREGEAGAIRAEGGNAQVRLTGAAVGHAPGETRPGPARGTAVAAARTHSLDELVQSAPSLGRANLLKTDVEGFDGRVLRGARLLLAEAAPVLFFELYPRLLAEAGDDAHTLLRDLAAAGYERFGLWDHAGAWVDAFDAGDEVLVADLLAHASRRPWFYYDACAFPARRRDDGDAFVARERERARA